MPLDSDDEAIAHIISAYKHEVGLDLDSAETFTSKDSGRDESSSDESSEKQVKDDQKSLHSESEDDAVDREREADAATSSNDEKKDDICVAIERPKTQKEKNLMAMVFGRKAELVSNLKRDSINDAGSDFQGSKRQRTAAWHDSDDDNDRDFPKKSNKHELKTTINRRRKNFEKIVGQPKWADLNRKQAVDSDDELLKTVGHVVKGISTDLPKENIELKRLKNLNRETKNEGEITAINFHPTSMVAVMTGMNGLASIVAVDGTKNEKLHTIGMKKFKIACCRMSPDGNEILFGSFRKFYHVYNLISGQSDTLQLQGDRVWTMKNFELSNCGKYIAVAGGFGEIHLLDARSKELLTTIQQNHCCSSLCFSSDSKYLLSHSSDNEVSVYHLEKRRFVNVFTDDGCVNGSFITICPNNRFVATGNRQEKTISNLTTSVGSMAFNVTSELLAIASPEIPNAVKLIHMKSGTVYRNFPMMNAALGHVTRVKFSPGSGYLALGSRESIVSLFRVKHYQNY
ncbi:U3 small nucleolar RNA-associated protein 18 homolog isoform X2 [Topomyia yanbarensis]|uniref:U3 small nucleolar RNA-associated protein 18 homolog isoform X2 n=1 Tax=Topomyia yanbarensis TaxID=2498891 RepID=UPI00273C468D|nr:U3 small nucleolar RNA-associated protein 18 homolog isoform X2 [Topomyia yanbarensis]